MSEEASTAIAEEQLDALERSDPDAYRDVMLLCGLVFDHTERAHAMSSAITTSRGIVMRLAVPGRSPLKLFWTREGAGDGPRIEAVLEHP
jgi:hypothetical protein